MTVAYGVETHVGADGTLILCASACAPAVDLTTFAEVLPLSFEDLAGIAEGQGGDAVHCDRCGVVLAGSDLKA